jgi:hypothetical protein
MGTRNIDSTPPTTTRSSKRERIFIAPRFTASSPDAQKQLICPRHADVPIGQLNCSLGDVGALTVNRNHTTEHLIIDLTGVKGSALLQCGEQPATRFPPV